MPVINENDTTTTDEITFGDNDFLAAQVAILLGADALMLLTDTDGLYTADPRHRPGRRADPRGQAVRGARGARDRDVDLAARLGRDALEGGGGRDGDRRGHPRADPERHPPGDDRGARSTTAARARASIPRRGACRASSCGSSTRSPRAAGSRSTRAPSRRCASAARACCRSASWACIGDFEAGDAVEVCPADNGRADRQGDRQLLGRRAAPDQGHEVGRGPELLPRASEEAVHRDYFVLG